MATLINNRWKTRNEARVDLFSDGLMFGLGLFETFRTYQSRALFRLDDHIGRLLESADHIGLNINYTQQQIKNMVKKVANASRHEMQRFKILAIPNQLIVISTQLILDRSIYQGVNIKSVVQQRALPEIKSTSYLDCLLSYQIARKAGFYDALLVDNRGSITEGSRCNVFWVEKGSVFTRQTQVLPGITRKVIIEDLSLNVKFKDISLQDLLNVNEICITNSVIGVIPVLQVDESKINNGKTGPLTNVIMDKYSRLCT